jgi:hypothetical protein
MVQAAEPSNLGGQGFVIRVKIRNPAQQNFRLVRCVSGKIQGLAIKSFGGAKPCGCLPRVERHAGGITVYVDDRARNSCADNGRIQGFGKGVKLGQPPVGILAREPGGNKNGLHRSRNFGARVRYAQDQWC